MAWGLGPGELLLIFGIILILFGPKKLPELARSLGKAKREYEMAMREATEPSEESGESKSAPVKKEKTEEEILLETAKKLGIDTEGKTIEQIAEEVLQKAKK